MTSHAIRGSEKSKGSEKVDTDRLPASESIGDHDKIGAMLPASSRAVAISIVRNEWLVGCDVTGKVTHGFQQLFLIWTRIQTFEIEPQAVSHQGIREGGALVIVSAAGDMAGQAVEIIRQHCAVRVDQHSGQPARPSAARS